MKQLILPAVAGLVLAAGPLAAQPALVPAATPGPAADRWAGSLTLYGWLPSVSGDLQSNSSGQRSDFSFDEKNILESLDFAAFATLNLQRGRLGFIVDALYTHLSNGTNLGGPFDTRVDGDMKMAMVTGAATWRVYQASSFFADALAGVRLSYGEVTINTWRDRFRGVSHSEQQGATWIDPLVGVRLGVDLTDRISLKGIADIGGFGIGSRLTWEFYAGAAYAITPTIRLEAGYRYISVDYDADRVTIDTRMQGLAAGVTFGF